MNTGTRRTAVYRSDEHTWLIRFWPNPFDMWLYERDDWATAIRLAHKLRGGTVTTDLAAWLLEQIAADERRAQASLGRETYAQLAWGFSAARVLAECAARRQIVEMCFAAWNSSYDLDADLAAKVLRSLAQPYADRPGFDPAWR